MEITLNPVVTKIQCRRIRRGGVERFSNLPVSPKLKKNYEFISSLSRQTSGVFKYFHSTRLVIIRVFTIFSRHQNYYKDQRRKKSVFVFVIFFFLLFIYLSCTKQRRKNPKRNVMRFERNKSKIFTLSLNMFYNNRHQRSSVFCFHVPCATRLH